MTTWSLRDAAGVKLAAYRTGDLRDTPLDRGVNVLVTFGEREAALLELGLDAIERGDDDFHLVGREDTGAPEAPHVRARAGEIVGRQLAVEVEADRVGEQLF